MIYDQFVVGGIVQTIRRDRKITQLDMAERLNISVDHYSKLEQGCEGMSLKILFGLMTILDVDANTLLLYGEDGSKRVARVTAKINGLKNIDHEVFLDSVENMIDSLYQREKERLAS